jgi:aspartyl-tRNA(Asn)/glutamyl-tRNA(Gln) amidotransferase subunit A
VEHTAKVLQEAKKLNREYHYYNTICEPLAKQQARAIKKNPKGRLAGVPVSVKDAICVQGVESTAGSKTLKGYKPLFDATVIQRLKKEGAIIIGKTAQDAFGFGSFSTNVGLDMKAPINPLDPTRACGGSSGGSAGITQLTQYPHLSLGESTGGSIAAPASFCGIPALCPTYGKISRYGLMDYANSLDKIGPMGKTIEDIALLLEIIAGHDPKDSTSLTSKTESYSNSLTKADHHIGIIKETLGKGTDPKIKDMVLNTIDESEIKHASVSLPLTQKYGVSTYFLLAMAEASTNLAKYCGMRYGKHETLKGSFNEYFSKVRSHNLNEESKRRIMIGTFARMAGYRDAFYLKATKIRTKIIEEYKKLFKTYDVLASPTMPIIAPTFKEIEKLTPLQHYMMDTMTVGPNLAGLPHMNVTIGEKDGMPVGLLLIADHEQESTLLKAAKVIENVE